MCIRDRATGAAYDDLSTVEGLVATAGAYYDWTDAQTPEPDDGKALFGLSLIHIYVYKRQSRNRRLILPRRQNWPHSWTPTVCAAGSASWP